MRNNVWKSMVVLLAFWGATVVYAESANASFVREIWVPESWSEPELTGGSTSRGGATIGRSFVPSIPTLRKREIGASVGVRSVTVHANRNPTITVKRYLRFEDGRRMEVKGKYMRIGKSRYEVMGQHGDYFYLRNDHTKKYWRFVTTIRSNGLSESGIATYKCALTPNDLFATLLIHEA